MEWCQWYHLTHKCTDLSEIISKQCLPSEEQDDAPDAKFLKLMWGQCGDRQESLLLPMVIKIKDPLPGELPFMRRRQRPAVLRFKKNKQASQPVKFFLQELVLYDHETTDQIYSLSDEEVIAKYLERQDFIRRVKNQVILGQNLQISWFGKLQWLISHLNGSISAL